MAPRYWIGVIAGDHAGFAAQEGICAFSFGKETAVSKLATGDRFAFYSPKTGLNEGASLQSITAIGTVTGSVPYERNWAGTENKAWVREAAFDESKITPLKPLIEQLGFISNPGFWGMAFRRSLFEISAEDFAILEAAAKP